MKGQLTLDITSGASKEHDDDFKSSLIAIIKAQDESLPEVAATDPKFKDLQQEIAYKIYDMLIDSEQYQ